ncbi:GtrA family protein [Pseudomonas sp. BN515]|uniref:GtrA family protein n=1 Tax=Pseudomonas sp. BN515 TaxID=2567892 RepID=UPI002457EF41|nr:GtrA family protein [Pseudomonas sp. BN515]MDH4872495.1 GtrA family protein [Pseudomonas sp. BN515]
MNRSFIRYAVVGLLSNLSGYSVYLLITWLGTSPKIAMSLLYIIGASLGFLGNRRWAFGHTGSVPASLLRYGLAHVLGYGLNFMMLDIFSSQLGYPHQAVQAVSVLIVAVFLFLMFRLFVFPQGHATGNP